VVNTSYAREKAMSDEILIVVSKLKKYVKDQSEMNTSVNVAPALSDMLRRMCDKAIAKAKAEGRKTVMDRDFETTDF
jgi:histone H3/H4